MPVIKNVHLISVQSWTYLIFWAAKEIWAKPVLKEVSVFLFFEEIDIFYFNLKSAW